MYDEQKKLAQFQAQTKSQMARYEDELARKRMQASDEVLDGIVGIIVTQRLEC